MKDKEPRKVSIRPDKFTQVLRKNNLGPVVEVPCSYLKDFLNYLWDSNVLPVINPANEAIAMAQAAGEYLGSGKIPVVAIQNSGLGNTINALTSLNQMYDIPAFMMVTWRGEGGVGKDAPEHDITGKNLLKYLKMYGLPHEIANPLIYKEQVGKLAGIARKTRRPVVYVVKKDTFEALTDTKQTTKENSLPMTRFDATQVIKKSAGRKTVFLSGTGFPSRDSFNAQDTPDFYVMGSMGHVLGIGMGVARTNPNKKVIVLDGDGGALMHAGAFASVDRNTHKNLIYVMLDNGLYESTGGQPSSAQQVDFKKFVQAFPFGEYIMVRTVGSLEQAIKKSLKAEVPVFLHVKVKPGGHAGARVSDTYSCPEVTDRFMQNLSNEKKRS